jgi:hypothetical protein
MALRSYDAFAKPIDGTRERSVSGGFITLLASSAAALLFISQLIIYIRTETRHSMTLADSVPSMLFDPNQRKNPNFNLAGHLIKVRLHVTFPHLPCSSLDYAQDGSISASKGLFAHYHSKPYTFTTRVPTVQEYKLAAVGGYNDQNIHSLRKNGCTLVGTIITPRVGGSLSVSVSPDAWMRATSMMTFGLDLSRMMGEKKPDPFHGRLPNVTHYLHDVTFGDPFPAGTNPLQRVHHVMDNESGVALANVAVKLVPTTYKRTFHGAKETYQASVSRHIVQPETLAAQQSTLLPGLMLTYDFTPLAVKHMEIRENWLVFLSSLVSIVGGVFVTVGLVSGCLVDSAKAVAKKID